MAEVNSINTRPIQSTVVENLQIDESIQASSQNELVSLLRRVAELTARILDTIQQSSQSNRDSIESLKKSVHTHTNNAVEQLNKKGDLTSGSGFVNFTVSILSVALLPESQQNLAKVFTDSFPRCIEYVGVGHDGQSMIHQMKGRLSEQDLQSKTNSQQDSSSLKQQLNSLMDVMTQHLTSTARGG